MRLELEEGAATWSWSTSCVKMSNDGVNPNWEGATNVTKDLLRHWWRKDRPRRFFFCQLEAAETIIFLNEIRGIRKTAAGASRAGPRIHRCRF